jgi:hypothetical protein
VERAVPLICALAALCAFVCLCALHLADRPAVSAPAANDGFAGPVTGKPRPLEVVRTPVSDRSKLKQVRCYGEKAADSRCWVASGR